MRSLGFRCRFPEIRLIICVTTSTLSPGCRYFRGDVLRDREVEDFKKETRMHRGHGAHNVGTKPKP